MQTNYTKIFNTVPLQGTTMYRKEDGTKAGFHFPSNWKQYQTSNTDNQLVRNQENTSLLAAIAGKDFIGIDFDTNIDYQIALVIDKATPKPQDRCGYIAKSDLKGGHFLYAYNIEDAEKVSLYNTWKALNPKPKPQIDLQLNDKLIYLATEANKTKLLQTPPLKTLDELTRIPQTMLQHISGIVTANLPLSTIQEHRQTSLQPQDQEFQNNSMVGLSLKQHKDTYKTLNIDILAFVVPPTLQPKHPKDVEQGQGTEWMLKTRGRLASDPTVSEVLFLEVMLYLNTLWAHPMDINRVRQDTEHDIKNTIWNYDEDWNKMGLKLTNRLNGDPLEIMYDLTTNCYLIYNYKTKHMEQKKPDLKTMKSYIHGLTGFSNTTQIFLNQKCEAIRLVNEPTLGAGRTISEDKGSIYFNTFHPGRGTQILQHQYTPINIIPTPTWQAFMDHIVPDRGRQHLLLSFFAHKHRTYQYTPLYFVFTGVQGAGKNFFIEYLLEYLSGPDRMESGLSIKTLEREFNSWMFTTDYAVLDELGEGAHPKELAKAVGTLKAITGSPTISKNIKHANKEQHGNNARHYITPIITTNENTKLITDITQADRRMVVIKIRNKLLDIFPDIGTFKSNLLAERDSFIYQMAQLPPPKETNYIDNRIYQDQDYLNYIEQTAEVESKLLKAYQDQDLSRFITILIEDVHLSIAEINQLFSLPTGKGYARFVLRRTNSAHHELPKGLFEIAEDTPRLNAFKLEKLFKEHQKSASGPNKRQFKALVFTKRFSPLTEQITFDGD